ncbi:FAD dependent oxidoreductase [Truncatella angustata]|uniref:FAD dependent oxidoreductase n=1 Tax=Truncatella angustata TaxID=152316 RepID=A0A9P8UHH1_9PEZI|nr:FAD dependent oxidoreductase [Truncatella angustata]KAH6652238.1 FAD dependent oxidoreductase [Truncatella angustata]
MPMEPGPRNIVIVGGGIIGSTTAYYLTRHPSYNPSLHRITILEATSIAAGASGKAGGLLGLWAYPQCLVPLSYKLHAELAAEHGGAERWGYRNVSCGKITATVHARDLNGVSHVPIRRSSRATDGKLENDQPKDWEKLPKQDETASKLLQDSKLPSDLNWIDQNLVKEYATMDRFGSTETSQVHPFQFTTTIATLAQEKGVHIRLNAKVTAFKLKLDNRSVAGIEYLDRATDEIRSIDGVTDVIVAAGPWTGRLIPSSSVEGLKADSVVFDADISPYAVFTNISLPRDWVPPHRAAKGQKRQHKGNVDPEVYARPGREAYACGEPDPSASLPETADLVGCDEAQCDDLVAYISTVSPVLRSAPVLTKQACFLPRHMRYGKEMSPLIGRTSVSGLWMASGHTCWGIQNGPATGKLMSEFIFEGAANSADISELDPMVYGIGA